MKSWIDLRIEEMEEKASNSGFQWLITDNNPANLDSFPFCAFMEDAYYQSLSTRLLNLIHV